jgi:hypothetical protein
MYTDLKNIGKYKNQPGLTVITIVITETHTGPNSKTLEKRKIECFAIKYGSCGI